MLAHIAEIALCLEFLVPDHSVSLLRGVFGELVGGACNGSHGNGGIGFGTLVYTDRLQLCCKQVPQWGPIDFKDPFMGTHGPGPGPLLF
jgi:hypothetical protein